jgi:hypothetical protein
MKDHRVSKLQKGVTVTVAWHMILGLTNDDIYNLKLAQFSIISKIISNSFLETPKHLHMHTWASGAMNNDPLLAAIFGSRHIFMARDCPLQPYPYYTVGSVQPKRG